MPRQNDEGAFYWYSLTYLPDFTGACFRAAEFTFDGTQIQYRMNGLARGHADTAKKKRNLCVLASKMNREVCVLSSD